MRASVAALFALAVVQTGNCAPTFLNTNPRASLQTWLNIHPGYRQATDDDCDCTEDIQEIRTKSEPAWPARPGFHPYLLIGDFRHNGEMDFAVVVVKRTEAKPKNGVLLIFDGPFLNKGKPPVYSTNVNHLQGAGLGPSPKGGSPVYGTFFSEGCVYWPWKRTYREDCRQDYY